MSCKLLGHDGQGRRTGAVTQPNDGPHSLGLMLML